MENKFCKNLLVFYFTCNHASSKSEEVLDAKKFYNSCKTCRTRGYWLRVK